MDKITEYYRCKKCKLAFRNFEQKDKCPICGTDKAEKVTLKEEKK